jgi:hypothetical protein
VELPKPRLDHDPGVRTKYRLTFVFEDDLPALEEQEFNRAGARDWPDDLPRPRIDTSVSPAQIEVRLEYEQIAPYIESLRKRVDATNQEIERRRPEREARDEEARELHRKKEAEFADAQRLIDEFFPG